MRKRIAIGAVAVLLVAGLVGGGLWVKNALTPTDPCPASYKSNSQEATEELASVVSVTVAYPKPPPKYFAISKGLGVVVGGYVLTAAHVVREAHELGPEDTLVAVGSLGADPPRILAPAKLIYYNEFDDIALLDPYILVEDPSDPKVILTRERVKSLGVLSARDLVLDTPVCFFSLTRGFVKGTISTSLTSLTEPRDPATWFAVDVKGTPVMHGSSGGPVYARLNGELKIVGVVHSKSDVYDYSKNVFRVGIRGTDIVAALNLINAEKPGLLKPVN